jgi:hypothetical protein
MKPKSNHYLIIFADMVADLCDADIRSGLLKSIGEDIEITHKVVCKNDLEFNIVVYVMDKEYNSPQINIMNNFKVENWENEIAEWVVSFSTFIIDDFSKSGRE